MRNSQFVPCAFILYAQDENFDRHDALSQGSHSKPANGHHLGANVEKKPPNTNWE
jgi:hypothetical protein